MVQFMGVEFEQTERGRVVVEPTRPLVMLPVYRVPAQKGNKGRKRSHMAYEETQRLVPKQRLMTEFVEDHKPLEQQDG